MLYSSVLLLLQQGTWSMVLFVMCCSDRPCGRGPCGAASHVLAAKGHVVKVQLETWCSNRPCG